MITKKAFRLNRSCSIILVLAWVLTILIGVCLFRLLQLPNELGTGLGRAGRMMNVLLSTKPGTRQVLSVYESGTVIREFIDKPGLFRGEEITISNDEWHALNVLHQQWCTNPPKNPASTGIAVYQVGISCAGASAFGQYIQVPETSLPAEVNELFKRIAV